MLLKVCEEADDAPTAFIRTLLTCTISRWEPLSLRDLAAAAAVSGV